MSLYNNFKKYHNDHFLLDKMNNSLTKDNHLTTENNHSFPSYHKCAPTHDDYKNRIFDKSVPLSKFRNILTEAISKVTRENTLKKGESVELTLQIELLKSNNDTPTNSLVEVTILEHNKVDRKNLTNPFENSKALNTEKGKLTINSQYQVKNDLNNKYHNNYVKANETTKTDNNFQNFIRVLPEQTSVNRDIKKGYQRVSGHEKDLKSISRFNKQRDTRRIFRKDSTLVKKLSNIFLPTNNVTKHADITNTTSTNEVNSKNQQLEKNTVNRDIIIEKKALDLDINKLQGNIPEARQPTITKKRRKKKIQKTTNPLYNSTTSYSDTCINYHAQEGRESLVRLRSSNHTEDSSSLNKTPESISITNYLQNTIMGDSLKNSKKKHKQKQKHPKQNKSEVGDKKSKHEIECKPEGDGERSTSIHNKKSEIYWNGETITINKDIKKRIEMIILSELQNLALKEGMECDVTPLPTTENSLKKVNRMSSFMCELDISDAKIKRTMKKLKSLDNKTKRSCERVNKIKSKHVQSKVTQKLKLNHQADNIMEYSINNTNDNNYLKSTGINDCELCSVIKQEKTSNSHDTNKTTQNLEMATELKMALLKTPVTDKQMSIKPVKSYTLYERKNHSEETIFRKGFVKKISSDDSNWYNLFSSKPSSERYKLSTYNTETSNIENNTVTSKASENKVEIELDIKELESVLKEAKNVHKADTIFIYTKCAECTKRQYKKQKRFTGKNNSPSYTNILLTKASKKLEKFAKGKQ